MPKPYEIEDGVLVYLKRCLCKRSNGLFGDEEKEFRMKSIDKVIELLFDLKFRIRSGEKLEIPPLRGKKKMSEPVRTNRDKRAERSIPVKASKNVGSSILIDIFDANNKGKYGGKRR